MMNRRFLMKCLPLLLLAAAVLPAHAAGPFQDAIVFKNLPDAKPFREQAQWYLENHDRLLRLGRDEYTSGVEAELRLRLAKLLEDASALIVRHPRNLDLLLFRVLLYWDFYAVNLSDYREEIAAEALRIESLFPGDFRAYWFLGTFYAHAVRPLESMKQFEFVTEIFKPEELPVPFWRGCASAALFADMPKHALEACRVAALLEKIPVLEEDAACRIAGRFQRPGPDTEIPPGSLYQFQEREGGFGLLCRLFGVYIPVNKDWGNQSREVQNCATRLVFTPPPAVGRKQAEIAYTITLECQAYGRQSFEAYSAERLRKARTAKKLEPVPGDFAFVIYELADPGVNRDHGGFRGLTAFLRRPEPAVKGLAVERPIASLINAETGEPYYRPRHLFDRYDGEIFYAVSLDCSDEIFDQAAETFRNFLKGLLFD